jgi:predicted RND superfamily exporter protein
LIGVLAVRHKGERLLPLLCLAVCALNGVGLVHYNLTYSQPQGRLLFPTIGALAVLVALGWRELCGALAPRLRATMVASALLIMAGCDVAVCWAYHSYNVRSDRHVRKAIATGVIVHSPPGEGKP